MALPPERPVADPLLAPEALPRDHAGEPMRAPIGNSIKTLALLGILALVGAGVWWLQRPSDLTDRLAGREWAIVEVDGEPAGVETGLVSPFALGADGEITGADRCNTTTGRWEFQTDDQLLDVEWRSRTDIGCPPDWPATVSIDTGRVDLDGAVLTVDTARGEIQAVDLDHLGGADAAAIAGRWTSGGATIDIGPRGLLRIGPCSGEWIATGEGISARFDEQEIAREGCLLDPIWTGGSVLLPSRYGDVLFLRREEPGFPLGTQIVRLDAAPPSDSPLVDSPLGDSPLVDSPLGDAPLGDAPLGDAPLVDG